MKIEKSRFIHLLDRLRGRFLGVTLVATFFLISSLSLLATSGWLLATAALRPQIGTLHVAIAGVRLFGLLRPCMRFVERYFAHDATLRLMGMLRLQLFHSLVGNSIQRFDTKGEAERSALFMSDVDAVEHLPLRIIFPVAAAATAALLFFVWSLFLTPQLALATGLILLSFFLVSLTMIRIFRAVKGEEIPKKRSDLEASTLVCIENRLQLAQCGVLSLHIAKLENEAFHYETRIGNGALRQSLIRALLTTLPWFASLSIAPTLYQLVAVSTLSAPTAIAYLLTLLALGEQVTSALFGLHAMPQIGASIERLFKNLAVDDKLSRYGSVSLIPVPPEMPLSAQIEAISIEFRYPAAHQTALSRVSFQARDPQLLLLAGPSGSGKSTLVSIFDGTHAPTAGALTLSAKADVAIPSPSIRDDVTSVSHRSYLFADTIRENLRFASPHATDAQLTDALAACGLETLASSPQRTLDLILEDNGRNLSAGERQRVLLAQASLRKRPFLMLDEAFSHIDGLSRERLFRRITAEVPLTVYAAHEIELFPLSDSILYLEEGRIEERGSFEFLHNKEGGRFSAFYRLESEKI